MTESTRDARPSQLLRVLGVGFGLAVVVGGVIGSGIMRNPGVVAQGLPDARLALLAWALGGALVMIDAMPTVELGASIPRAGGPYALIERAFGPRAHFLIGWADWLQIAISTGFIAVAFGEFLQRLGILPNASPGIMAVALVIVCGVINWIGTRVGGASQNLGSALKALGLLVLVAALFLAPRAAGAPIPAPPPPALTLAGVIMAMRAIYGAYGGWHAAVYFSEEVHQPERNVARVTFGGIALVGLLYVLVNAAVFWVLPIGAAARSNLAVADAARVVMGPWSERLVTALAAVSVAAITNLQIMQHVRVTFAMGRNGVLPPVLARVAAGGTPRISLAVVLGCTIAIIAAASLAKGQVYETLLNLYAPLAMVVFLVMALGAMRLRKREPDLPRPWRMPLHPLPALFSIVINAVLLGLFLLGDWKTSLWSTVLLAAGLPLYFYGAKRWRAAA